LRYHRLLTVFLLLGVIFAAQEVSAGAYIFAGESNGTDVVTHPGDYTGFGTTATVNVCIVPSSPNASSLEIPLQNVIDHFNQLTPSLYNLRTGSDNNLTSSQVDWESTAIHEVGHCIGMAHPNLASESSLSAPINDSTKSTNGADNIYNTNSGADGVYGSGDDIRGDDENLHWFTSGVNNPFTAPDVIDTRNFARNLALLPGDDNFAANADRRVAGLFGVSGTEAVMQQLTYYDEDQRSLVADEVNTLRFARTGLDRTHGTADDYTVNLTYGGISSTGCDINVSFNSAQTGFAVCKTSGSFINSSNIRITSANVYMNSSAFTWYFTNNRVPAPVNDAGAVANGGTMTTVNGGADSLIANDTHPSSAPLSLSTTTFGGADHGTVSLIADGTFSYTHDGVGPTSDHFIYRVCMTSDVNACSFGRVDIEVTTVAYTIGGTVSGLTGSGLVLQNNGGDSLQISANGGFTFPTPVADAGGYAVSVLTQPGTPSQTCTVSNGSGTVAGADVTNVAVSCVTNSFTVGGTISDLASTGLVLSNNGQDIAIPKTGPFTFTFDPQVDGIAYAVTVKTQPTELSQTCTVNNGSGTLAGVNVTDVAVTCTTDTFTVGGNVSDLAGTGLVLQNNAGDDLSIGADGNFEFGTTLDDGNSYSVSIKVQPTDLSQTCSVTNSSGTLAGADITDVSVTCVTNTYTVGGNVSGLAGSGLVLQNNAGDDLVMGADGGFNFATELDDGSTYSVTIKNQPTSPTQICSVLNALGILAGANITDVTVTCTTLADHFVTTWQTDNPGTSNSTSIAVPMAGGPYDVDWNDDGAFDQFGLTGSVTHDYGVADTYTIRIRGTNYGFAFGPIPGDTQKIVSLDQWGANSWTSMNFAFYGAVNLTVSATDTPNFSEVTGMSAMFSGASLADPDTSGWDTTAVTSMNNMFRNASSANPDTSNWDTSAVTDMWAMFSGATAAEPDTSGWNTSAVTDMHEMFYNATSANPDTNGWDTSAVSDMNSMFLFASSVKPDVSGWDTAAVTDMSQMFWGVPSFDQNIGSWDVTSLTNALYMFENVTLSTSNYDSLLIGWNSQSLQPGVTFSGGNSTYCSATAVAARTNMIASDSWVITDGEKSCPPGYSCNVNMVSGITEHADISHEACEILAIGSDFIAADGSNVSVNSGWEIEFLPGFIVEPGATFKANVCGQSLCMTSPSPMPYGCHSCVDQICDIDPSCCALEFNQTCLDMVDTVCGLVCE
jgi:surface protein